VGAAQVTSLALDRVSAADRPDAAGQPTPRIVAVGPDEATSLRRTADILRDLTS